MSQKIGFVSFRFAGTDGVTLETIKFANAFSRLGCESYFCAGESTMPNSMIFPEMHFNHAKVHELTGLCFGEQYRSHELTAELHNLRRVIKKQLYSFINEYSIDVLVLQNLLALPMNIPFSMALVEVIAETRIPAIAHHHDFFWERERFNVNCVQDILKGCFPPNLSNMAHLVINSHAQRQLSYRNGVSSIIVPNVMDFETPPLGLDSYNASMRADLDIADDTLLVLQPTRIVQRKGIEHAIELVHRLGEKVVILISHEAGDEGNEYKTRVLEYANMLNVEIKMCAEKISEERGLAADGSKIFDLNDVYACTDIVTYPSLIEGFGNALLETYYFKKPVIVNIYPVYASDIRTKGFKAIEFTNFISKSTVEKVKNLLQNPQEIRHMVDTNYKLGLKYYSFTRLYYILKNIMENFFGV